MFPDGLAWLPKKHRPDRRFPPAHHPPKVSPRQQPCPVSRAIYLRAVRRPSPYEAELHSAAVSPPLDRRRCVGRVRFPGPQRGAPSTQSSTNAGSGAFLPRGSRRTRVESASLRTGPRDLRPGPRRRSTSSRSHARSRSPAARPLLERSIRRPTAWTTLAVTRLPERGSRFRSGAAAADRTSDQPRIRFPHRSLRTRRSRPASRSFSTDESVASRGCCHPTTLVPFMGLVPLRGSLYTAGSAAHAAGPIPLPVSTGRSEDHQSPGFVCPVPGFATVLANEG